MDDLTSTVARILVFDSGLGGLSIVENLVETGINSDVYYCADTAYFPYGEKSDDALIDRVPFIISQARSASMANIVIIACNTASTLALDHVRARINIPVIGVVPAIKPAVALTKSGVIGLLGTPNTVKRPYTDKLVSDFAQGKKVLRHGAIGLAAAAEAILAGRALDPAIVLACVDGLFGQPDGEKIDTVVLACTHYPHLKAELQAAAPHSVTWVDSGAAIARRARTVLNLTTGAKTVLCSAFTTGGDDVSTSEALRRWGFEKVLALPPMA